MPVRQARSHCCLIAGVALMLAASTAWAESGIVQTYPLPRIRMRSGLTMEVDTRGVSANGYRAVRVKVINTPSRNKPPAPVTADRRLRIVLEPNGFGHVSRVRTSKVIEIPEKQSSAEATIPIPTAGDWYEMEVSVYEGGDKLDDVSGPMATGFLGLRADTETLPTLLFVDADVPDRATRDNQLSMLAARPAGSTNTYDLPDFSNLLANIPYANLGTGVVTMPAGGGGTRLTDDQVLASVTQQSKVQLLPPGEVPSQWVALSCYDITFISLDDLTQMAKQHPRQRRTLVDWLHSGPALVVYGVGDNFERLKEVEQLLELGPLPEAADEQDATRGWTRAKAEDSGRTVFNFASPVYYGPNGSAMATTATLPPGTAATPGNQLWIHRKTAPFVGRPAGLGWVVAISDSDPFPAQPADWQWLLQSIPSRHRAWSTRHGMTYLSYNQGLWNWYIPGVGAAPVFSFLLLATLFAVVIGPVNYLLLGKINRLYLLLVTVPLGAAVVTLSLFAYAVFSDGLGVKARIRSFTLLDQKEGRTVSWSRQSYYASLVPSQGLHFPNDAVIWPLDEKPTNNRRGPLRQLAWEADGQRLRSGYLSSRRLTQLMVTRSGRTKSQLAVARPAGSPPRVTNELGGTIEQLFLCDQKGDCFWSKEPLAAGRVQTLNPLEASRVQEKLTRIVNAHLKEFPEGYDAVAEMRRTNTPWFRNSWGTSGNASLDSSLLEVNINSLRGSDKPLLQPGMYVAVLKTNPDVPLGVPRVSEVASFHVLVGRW